MYEMLFRIYLLYRMQLNAVVAHANVRASSHCHAPLPRLLFVHSTSRRDLMGNFLLCVPLPGEWSTLFASLMELHGLLNPADDVSVQRNGDNGANVVARIAPYYRHMTINCPCTKD